MRTQVPKYVHPHTSVPYNTSIKSVRTVFFAISLQHVTVMNIYSSMDAAIILSLWTAVCLFKHCWLTTGSWKMLLRSWKNPGFFCNREWELCFYIGRFIVSTLTTRLQYLAVSANLTRVREMSRGKSCQGKLFIAYFKLVATSVFSRLLQALCHPFKGLFYYCHFEHFPVMFIVYW